MTDEAPNTDISPIEISDRTKLIQVESNNEFRCEGPGSGGESQCRYMSLQGMATLGLVPQNDVKNCPKHGSLAHINRRAVHDLRLAQWQARLDQFAESDKVKSLRGEIGVLRILLEQSMNQCRTEKDLLMNSGKISDLVVKIEKLVASCHRLETNLSMVLDRNELVKIANNIVIVVNNHVKDSSLIEQIAGDIAKVLFAGSD